MLDYAVDGAVCTLTMNRPARRNALSPELVNELIIGLETARDDERVRSVHAIETHHVPGRILPFGRLKQSDPDNDQGKQQENSP